MMAFLHVFCYGKVRGAESTLRICRRGYHPLIILFCLWSVVFSAGEVLQNATETNPSGPVEERLSGVYGVVQWTEDRTLKYVNRMWTVDVPPDHGTVLCVKQISLRKHGHLRVYMLSSGGDVAKMKKISEWTQTRHPFPILVIKGTVMFNVEMSEETHEPLSKFTIMYEVYNVSSLPQKIEMQSDIVSSRVMFNCSTSIPVPKAMACDHIKHCIGDEDEEDCEYRQQGCGDWIPDRDQCLKLDFAMNSTSVHNHSFITAHTEAEQACHDNYGASLAVLPVGLLQLARVISKSGFSSVAINLRKVKPVSRKHDYLYRYLWQWGSKGSPIMYDYEGIQRSGTMHDCVMLDILPQPHLHPVRCYKPTSLPDGYLCQRPNPSASVTEQKQTHGVYLPEATRSVHQFSTKQCDDGSVVQVFHQCQWRDHVLSTSWSPNHLPLFYCLYGPPVHYSLLCDGFVDCADGSDELGCMPPRYLYNQDSFFICENYQVIRKQKQCDGVQDCFDGSDEQDCTRCQQSHCLGVGCVPYEYVPYFERCTETLKTSRNNTRTVYIDVAFVVYLDGYGMSSFQIVPNSADNLEGHFECSNGIYIPTYLLNNGELDCPEGEDEKIPLENFTCPGFYRCQSYGNCIHSRFLCDGISHCPNKDDERYCNLIHPSNCTCEGYACSCHVFPRPVSDFWYLRYLDVSGVYKPPVEDLVTLDFLQFLNASFCQLTNVTLVDMPQLKILDLSYNALSGLSSMVMESLTGVKHLNVSGNPLVSQLDASFSAFFKHAGLINTQHLVMINTHVHQIGDSSFGTLGHLVSLDIRNNKLQNYDKNMFGGLHSLKVLQTDDQRLCCPYFHHTMLDCYAPVDELSSCSDLLRLDFFRVFLWCFSLLTILGNSGVLMSKVIARKKTKMTSYRILVSHLCVADFLMGIYMMIIGAADAYFRGSYVANERNWRQSGWCLASGFLAFLSSEMSAFIICLITLDRMLMLCFPFKSHLHLSTASSMKLSCAAWVLGLLLAAVPLIGQLEFYGESSICLPLPITRHQFSGHTYAFLVFIVLNFLLFLFIGGGQVAIYWTLRKTRRAVRTKQQIEDSTVAQRLFLVVFTDFCCWFPVGLIGLMASAGLPIPGEVTVWVAVFVMPINSALNPFLYSLNRLWEKWSIKKMNKKSKIIFRNLRGEFPQLAPEIVEEIMLTYLGFNKGVRLEEVFKVLRTRQEIEKSSDVRGPLDLTGESTCIIELDEIKTQVNSA